MNQISYKHIGSNKLQIIIPFTSGTKNIIMETVITPDRERSILFDNYIISMKGMGQNATDIDFYINKMQQAFNNINIGKTNSDTIIYMINEHTNQFGRIIDTDLMMMASALAKLNEAKGEGYQINTLIKEAISVVKQFYIDKLFITVYQRTMLGIQPKIIPASQYGITNIWI